MFGPMSWTVVSDPPEAPGLNSAPKLVPEIPKMPGAAADRRLHASQSDPWGRHNLHTGLPGSP